MVASAASPKADERGVEVDAPLAGAALDSSISHNLAGQKLGRKGRITRERILSAAAELIEEGGDEPITLSAIARRASLGLTSLYNYFSDLTEVILALLEPVSGEGREEFIAIVRDYWPDDELAARCVAFVQAYHRYWSRHSGLLHLRNSMADQFDVRMMRQRVSTANPVIEYFVRQMTRESEPAPSAKAFATVLMTGVERSVTLHTDRRLHRMVGLGEQRQNDDILRSIARLMELAIRDARTAIP